MPVLFRTALLLLWQEQNSHQEVNVRRFVVVFLFLMITSLSAQAQSAPEIPYESVPNLLKLPPHLYLGEACGVAVNSKGHIFVFSRSGHTQLLEFGPDGDFIRLIGDDLYGFLSAHDVRVDKDDNIWTVDVGTNMVVKFNPEGQVAMLLGRRSTGVEGGAVAPPRPDGTTPPVPPALVSLNNANFFYGPTDVAFGPNGETYVSDGHGHSQVVKFDKNGNWVKAWGKTGTAPGEFQLPHGIATDAKGNVYVADRKNNRVQVFDPDGNFLKQWTNVSPVSICITPPPHQVAYTSVALPGRIYKLDLEGNILGGFGKAGKQLGEFGVALEVTCPSENVVFVAEPTNWRVQKFILHPNR